MNEDQSDLEILTDMMEDYDMEPTDTLADFLEALVEEEKESNDHPPN